MGILPFESEAVARRLVKYAFNLAIVLPAPEDLIIFKSISQRPIDIEDIKAIITRNPDLDKKRILSTVNEFSDALGLKDIYENIKNLLK